MQTCSGNRTCGRNRRALNDAAGIFCCYICDRCESAKRRQYNPAIFDPGTVYAQTGDESDIDSDYPPF